MAGNSSQASMAGIVIKAALRVLIYFLVAVVFYYGASISYSFGYRIFANEAASNPPGTDKTIRIKEGNSVSDTAGVLEESGIIADKIVFYLQARFYEYEIYPGTYELNSSMSPKEILKEISQKPADDEDSSGKEPGTEASQEP